MAEKSPTGHTV